MSEDEKQLTFKILVKLRAHLVDIHNLQNTKDAAEQMAECEFTLTEIENALTENLEQLTFKKLN